MELHERSRRNQAAISVLVSILGSLLYEWVRDYTESRTVALATVAVIAIALYWWNWRRSSLNRSSNR